MKRAILASLGTAVLILTACGGSPNGSAPSATPAPASPAPAIFVAGVLEQSGSGFRMNQHLLDVREAEVTFNGLPSSTDALRSGVTLSGTATAQGQDWRLRKVDIQSQFQGPLEAVDHDLLRILGASVVVTGQTALSEDQGGGRFKDLRLEDLHLQDDLTVFGVRSSGSQLEATRIERHRQGSENQVETRGTVLALDPAAARFMLNGTRVDFRTAQVEGSLAESVEVEVRGILAGGAIAASRVKVEGGSTAAAQGEAELLGTISDLDSAAKTFRLLTFTIDFSQATVVGTLANGAWVQIHATHQAAQPVDRISATTVKVEAPAQPAVGEESRGILLSVDLAARTFSLGTSSFWVDEQTIIGAGGMTLALNGLQPGAELEVHFDSTRLNTAGLPYAFRIEVEELEGSSEMESSLEGKVGSFDAASMSFALEGVTVKAGAATVYQQKRGPDLSASDFWSTDRNGAKVEAKGSRMGTTLMATRIELK
jgi:hypothetical protein